MLYSPLPNSFLIKKSILITGATGFIGKCLLEQLVKDHHSHINQIYLLIRPSSTQCVQQRLIEIFQNTLFSSLRDYLGSDKYWKLVNSKVVAIEGDLTTPGIICKDEDYRRIKRDCNYLIHCASNTGLNEDLINSYNTDFLGTKNLLELCDQFQNFEGFQFISSVLVNYNLEAKEEITKELIYPQAINGEDLFNLIDKLPTLSQKQLSELTKKILKLYPNINIFIKSLIEHYILDYVEFMKDRELKSLKEAWPINIIRASMILGTAMEPVKGWSIGLNTGNGMILSGAIGELNHIDGDDNNSFVDITPVDYLVQIMIKSLATLKPPGINYTLSKFNEKEGYSLSDLDKVFYPKIYQVSSSNINSISWGTLKDYLQGASIRLPLKFIKTVKSSCGKGKVEGGINSIASTIRTNVKSKLSLNNSQNSHKNKVKSFKVKLNELQEYSKQLILINTNTLKLSYSNIESLENQIILNNLQSSISSINFSIDKLRNLNWESYLNWAVFGIYYYNLNSEDRGFRIPDTILDWECSLNKVITLPSNSSIKVLRAKSTKQVNNDKLNNTDSLSPLLSPNLNTNNATTYKRGSRWKRLSFIPDKSKYPTITDLSPELKKELQNLQKIKDLTFNNSTTIKFKKFLNTNFNRLEVNIGKLNEIRSKLLESSSEAKVIYASTFKSIIDPLILSYLTNKFKLPKNQFIVENGLKVCSYGLINDTSVLKECQNLTSNREELIEELLVQSIYSGGSIQLINNNQGYNNTNLLSNLISRIRSLPNIGPVYILPISISYDIPLDLDYLIKEWCSPTQIQFTEQINITPKNIGISGYFNFNELIPITSVNEDFKLNSTISIINKSKSIQEQSRIITSTNLLAAIILFYKSIDSKLLISDCRRAIRNLGELIISQGYLINWSQDEDLNSVLFNAIESIGSEYLEVSKLNNNDNELIVKQSINTGILLEILANPIINILSRVGIWFAAYIICYTECIQDCSKSGRDSGYDDDSNNSNSISRDKYFEDYYPKLIDLIETYKLISDSLSLSIPNLNQLITIDKSFTNILTHLSTRNFINTYDNNRVKLNSTPIANIIKNISLYYLNPGLFIINGILINLVNSKDLIVGRERLLIQWTTNTINDGGGNKYSKLSKDYVKGGDDNEERNLEGVVNDQVIKWWSKLLLLNTKY